MVILGVAVSQFIVEKCRIKFGPGWDFYHLPEERGGENRYAYAYDLLGTLKTKNTKRRKRKHLGNFMLNGENEYFLRAT